MREIKIRIFDKKNKKLLEVDTLFINERMFKPVGGDEYSVWNYDTEYYSNPMQYTGLKDKNGVEIYEYMGIEEHKAIEFRDELIEVIQEDNIIYIRGDNG